MKITGICTLNLAIGQVDIQHEVIIADIESEGLLGSDFLSKHDCVLNFKKGVLEIDGETIPYREHVGSVTICRVKVAETVTIPAGGETVLAGRLMRRGKHIACGIVEPSSQFVAKTGVLVGKSLVDPTNKPIPVRVMNFMKEVVNFCLKIKN